MNKLTITGLGIGLALSFGTTAFAAQTCNGRLFEGRCFEKLEPVECYLVPFIFDDDENVIGGGGLVCTGAVSRNKKPIVVGKDELKVIRSASGEVTTYLSAKKVAKFKAGADATATEAVRRVE